MNVLEDVARESNLAACREVQSKVPRHPVILRSADGPEGRFPSVTQREGLSGVGSGIWQADLGSRWPGSVASADRLHLWPGRLALKVEADGVARD